MGLLRCFDCFQKLLLLYIFYSSYLLTLDCWGEQDRTLLTFLFPASVPAHTLFVKTYRKNASILQTDSGDEACDVRWRTGWLWGCRRVKLNLWERLLCVNQGCFPPSRSRWWGWLCQFTLTTGFVSKSPDSSTADQSLRSDETFPWLSSLTPDLFLVFACHFTMLLSKKYNHYLSEEAFWFVLTGE